jgi:hypothetical protein
VTESQTASPTPGTDTDDLHLVLFGLPAAGKSSLLGALGQAAGAQEHLLGGKLEARSAGLAELGRQLYEESTQRTPEEVVPYPVHYEPFPVDGQPAEPPLDAVLLDCDGRVANDILVRKQSVDEDSPEGTLAHEVADADALLLVVDASAPPAQIDLDFTEFCQFLESMQQGRGKRAEVAGLPVFLVLTKCDLLAQPGDNAGAWMERIEQRKREVGERFRAFLAEQDSPPSTPQAQAKVVATNTLFGRLELHVWATAIKRPALAGTLARPREPYGVAELFRQALGEAADYRKRCERSQRRLNWLVASTVLLVGMMATLALVLFVVNSSSRASVLRDRVEDFRFLDKGTPAERLKGGPEQLRAKLARLEDIQGDPQYGRLSADLRSFVEERVDELKSYIPYLEKILALPPLAGVQTEEGLEQVLATLRDELAPPIEDWSDTYAAQLRKERMDSAEAMRRAAQAARNWYLDSAEQAGRLWTFADYQTPGTAIDWPDWAGRTEKLLEMGRQPPFRESDPVPGVARGAVTQAQILRLERVLEARTSWDEERAKLARLLDIATALGLAPATTARPAVLVFPRDLTLAVCKARLAELKEAYPDYEKSFLRDGLPEAVLPRLRQAARRQYELLLRPARAVVLERLRKAGTGNQETSARWEAVAGWLKQPEELTAWRELTRIVLRLDVPSAPEPIEAIVAFLGKKQFTIEVRSFTLEVPELRSLLPRAEARLVILHPQSKRQPALAFEPSGEPARDMARRLRIYRFQLTEGQRLLYTPGDKLWAELPLRGGKERLVWSQSRSALYQFDRLLNPPRQQSSSAASLDEGRLLDDVRLIPRPEDGVPPLPDLMPTVKLE